MSLLLIETKTKKYAEAYTALTDSISKMEKEIAKVKNKFMPDIKVGVHHLKSTGEDLYQALNDNKILFTKPKTQVFHNIKVGFIKGKGKKEFDNETTIKLIKKHLPAESVDIFVQIKETVISKNLDKLSAAELKKIGVNIVDAQDEVIIKPVDSEIQKAIDAILNEIDQKEKAESPVIVLGENN